MIAAHDKHVAANRNMEKWNPRSCSKNGKNFTKINPRTAIKVMQNVTPNSLICSGITSPMTVNGSVKIAHDAKNMTVDKLANGIQLNTSTSYCHDFSIMYTPNADKPKAAPVVDKTYKNCKNSDQISNKVLLNIL